MYTFFYKTKPGDTLSLIAEKFGIPVETLINVNNLSSSEEIYPDQWILINSNELPMPKYYKVVTGDTLASISEKLGVSVDEILTLNDIPIPDLIYPGQIIQIIN